MHASVDCPHCRPGNLKFELGRTTYDMLPQHQRSVPITSVPCQSLSIGKHLRSSWLLFMSRLVTSRHSGQCFIVRMMADLLEDGKLSFLKATDLIEHSTQGPLPVTPYMS